MKTILQNNLLFPKKNNISTFSYHAFKQDYIKYNTALLSIHCSHVKHLFSAGGQLLEPDKVQTKKVSLLLKFNSYFV